MHLMLPVSFRRDYQPAPRNNVIPLHVLGVRARLDRGQKHACLIAFMQTQFTTLRWLSGRELLARVHSLAQKERQASACLIAHVAELESSELYRPESCSSMFIYCTLTCTRDIQQIEPSGPCFLGTDCRACAGCKRLPALRTPLSP